jgi:hypothetical protein
MITFMFLWGSVQMPDSGGGFPVPVGALHIVTLDALARVARHIQAVVGQWRPRLEHRQAIGPGALFPHLPAADSPKHPDTLSLHRVLRGFFLHVARMAFGILKITACGPWHSGGDEEDRTPDLRIANATLSQLSYVPDRQNSSKYPARNSSIFKRYNRQLRYLNAKAIHTHDNHS